MRASWPSCCASIISARSITANTAYERLKELLRSYLTISNDLGSGDDAAESDVPQLGHSLHRQASLCAAPSCRVARRRSAKPGCAAGRSSTTNNSMRCGRCVSKCGANLLAESKKHKAWKLLCQIPSIGPIRAAVVDRRFCRRRTASAPSGSCGPTAALASRRTAAPIIGMSKGSCNDRRDKSRFAGSTAITITI